MPSADSVVVALLCGTICWLHLCCVVPSAGCDVVTLITGAICWLCCSCSVMWCHMLVVL